LLGKPARSKCAAETKTKKQADAAEDEGPHLIVLAVYQNRTDQLAVPLTDACELKPVPPISWLPAGVGNRNNIHCVLFVQVNNREWETVQDKSMSSLSCPRLRRPGL
jgi:hypothetical protein